MCQKFSLQKLHKMTIFYIEQSGVIPFRISNDKIEVLLITSRKGKRWVIPKGLIEPHLTPPASAAQEALEEAGIIGEVSPTSLGSYTYQKWGGTCRVKVFLLRVNTLQSKWLESDRKRQWFSLKEAIECIQEVALKEMFKSLPNNLNLR